MRCLMFFSLFVKSNRLKLCTSFSISFYFYLFAYILYLYLYLSALPLSKNYPSLYA